MAYLFYVLLCIIFGTTFLAIKIGSSHDAPPLLFAGSRFLVAGALLFSGLVLFRKEEFPTGSLLRKAAVLGLFMIAVSFGCMYWAMDFLGSSLTAQMQCATPVLVAVLSGLFLKQRFSKREVIGILGGILGLFIMGMATVEARTETNLAQGMGLLLVSNLGYAAGSVYYKARVDDGSPLLTNSLSMTFGGACLVLVSLWTETYDFAVDTALLGSWLYLVILGSVVGHSLFFIVAKALSPFVASTWLYVSPVLATILGSLILDEHLFASAIAGMAVIVMSTLLIHRRRSAR